MNKVNPSLSQHQIYQYQVNGFVNVDPLITEDHSCLKMAGAGVVRLVILSIPLGEY